MSCLICNELLNHMCEPCNISKPFHLHGIGCSHMMYLWTNHLCILIKHILVHLRLSLSYQNQTRTFHRFHRYVVLLASSINICVVLLSISIMGHQPNYRRHRGMWPSCLWEIRLGESDGPLSHHTHWRGWVLCTVKMCPTCWLSLGPDTTACQWGSMAWRSALDQWRTRWI